MYNLLSNAIKFTPDGGNVWVTAGIPDAASADTTLAGEALVVAVKDSGIGIQARDQERVFQEFEQVDSSYGRQQQGTGLGLALTKRLVEMHGGRIWVESEGVEGRGSTFTFLIPLPQAIAKPSLAEDQPAARDDTLRPRVLLVTDDAASQERAAGYLIEVGYEVAVVSRVAAILGAVQARWFYAVVIDSNLLDPAGDRELATDRSILPARLPLVIFSAGDSGRPTFRLFAKERPASGPLNFRLVDAIRRTGKSTGKELKTVLIIDDEPALLELLTKTLLQAGFRVLRADGGRQGVALATRHHPDVIILDFSMPEFDGGKVVEQLRANSRTKAIPILIQTGTVLTEAERQHLAGHVQAITSKTERGSLLAELERLDELNDEAVSPEACL